MIKKTKPEEGRTIFSPGEACYYIGLSWTTLKRLIDEGEIRVVRVGRRYLIPKESLDAFVEFKSVIVKDFLKSFK
ncbi:MAG: excisionase family DNA-binding protein [Nitrospirae bacterium]|nr:excisionase family DNA-binding protein [Nitrospirota bacterium]